MKQTGDRRQETGESEKERSDGREGRGKKEKSECVSVYYKSEKGEGG